jgi:hypothetical protein
MRQVLITMMYLLFVLHSTACLIIVLINEACGDDRDIPACVEC